MQPERLRPWETAAEDYRRLLADKARQVEGRLRQLGAPPARVFPSAPLGYRARAEFRFWHDGADSYYVMFDPAAPRQPVRIDDFPAALPRIRTAMPALRRLLLDDPALRRRLFQVEFMATTRDELLLTLVYHRPLDSAWEVAAAALATSLGASVVGRSRGEKRVIGRDYVIEAFTVEGREYRYRQYEQAFVQPNAGVNASMLAWASAQARELGGDLLELYCGNGNFTLPLAAHFDAVLATELSKSATRAARENLADNAVDNVSVLRLGAEEVSAALAGERCFRRLAALPQPLHSYRLDSVFVDPPRAGLDAATLACVRRFRHILYVSCNPGTLCENLRELRDTHAVTALALFDQFPYTDHMECGVLLHRL